MRALKAFTILEVLIVVLLTALIVLMAMSVIQIVHQQFSSYAEDHHQSERLRAFQVLLETDFLQSEYAMIYGDALEFQHHNHQVNYQFEPDFIVRTLIKKTLQRDTFYLLTRYQRAFFEQQVLEKGWIDHLIIELYHEGEQWPMAFRKKYSAFDLMKKECANKN
ncbi:MAG: type II secretion system protein [Bacteroidota bacterium]